MADEDLKLVLEKALADGTITREQYQKMVAEPVPESPEKGRDRMQTVLVSAGVILLVAVIGFWVMMVWGDLGYYFKITMLGLSAAGMFLGSFLARRVEFDKLHFGLLAGASNLFVMGYGYWFYYELYVREASDGYLGWENIVPAHRSLALAIPLIAIPVIVLCYLIYRNSRLGSQGALLSLLFGGEFFLLRAVEGGTDSSGDSAFLALGLIGLAILISAAIINIQWWLGRWKKWKKFYILRIRTFNSLMATGFVLGSLYILFAPAAIKGDSDGLINGAIWMIFPAFVTIIFGVERGKVGLVMAACGIIILATWIAGLGFSGSGVCVLPLAIMTALMLIGIAFLLRRIPRRGRESEIINNP